MPAPEQLGARVHRLEEDLTAIADTVVDIKQTVDRHSREFVAVRRTLDEHTRRLDHQDRILDRHTETLDRHTELLTEILRRLDPR